VKSFERIHRANLVMMGVLPLQFTGNDSVASLGIKGDETVDVLGIEKGVQARQEVAAVIRRKDGSTQSIKLLLRIDTPIEVDYYEHGGILPFVLRELLGTAKASARAA
jgi:aconitate hydratase